ncbi:SCO2400 family protein [Streptomyces dangxiongensis]|uniref:SCO2400 family protein n=1 Tax=Streptomyces dangxiongensis TaxID=1442032 RepID=UPI0013CEB960|nr:hypothetical protein [Streptomyces dangxiongensis]
MNFCHPCQRHLNGALACPGCGTPATYAQTPTPVYEAYTYTPAEHTPRPAEAVGGHPYGESSPGGGPAEAAGGDPYGDSQSGGGAVEAVGGYPYGESERTDQPAEAVEGVATAEGDIAPTGRRARGRAEDSRRDRKAAAHRRRRRRTALVAAGFVLAAGGLSLAELGTDMPFSPFTGDKPAPAGEAAADGGTSPAAAARTADPLDAVSAATPGRAGLRVRGCGLRVGLEVPSGEGFRLPVGSGDRQARAVGHDAFRYGRCGRPRTTGRHRAHHHPDDGHPHTTTAPTPTPTPTPTRTCDRFLWWCT